MTPSRRTHFKKVFPHPLFTLKYRNALSARGRAHPWRERKTQPSRSAQVTNDAGKIDAAVAAAFHEALVDRGGARAERGGGVRGARGGLRQLQVLEHHGRGEARLVVAVRGRRRYRPRDRAIARHRPAL